MTHNVSTQQSPSRWELLRTPLRATATSLLIAPLEYPILEYPKIQRQAQLRPKPHLRIVLKALFDKKIPVLSRSSVSQFATQGVLPYYAGSLTFALQSAGRQFLRWGVMGETQRLLMTHYSSISKDDLGPKIIGGFINATLDTFIFTSFQRLQIVAATDKTHKHKYINFIYEKRDKLRSELFRGIKSIYIRNLVAWGTFLVPYQAASTFGRRHFRTQMLSPTQTFAISIPVALFNSSFTIPFDNVKTNLMKIRPMKDRGTLNNLSFLANKYGVRAGLYAGFRIRLAQYILHSFISCFVLEKMGYQPLPSRKEP